MTAVEIEEALKLGIQAHKAGRLQEADQYYTRILRVFPKHPDANHNMGVLAVGIGQISRSLEFFWRALESHKNVVQFWVSLIDAYIRLERYQDAVQTIEAAQKNGVEENALSALLKRIPEEYTQVSERPSLQEIQSLITLYNSGAYSEVLSQSSKLLNKYSNYFLIHNIRGAAYAAVGSYKEAIQSYEIAVQLNPKYADAYNNMGIAQQKDDDFDNAVLSYQKAIELKPDFAEAYNNLGALFNERENYAEAINILEQAVQLENTFSPLYTNLGIANKNLGKLDEAISFYQKALELSPENQNVLYNLGVAFYENGQLQKAMNCYDNALKINPNSEQIKSEVLKILNIEALDKKIKSRTNLFQLHLKICDVMQPINSSMPDQSIVKVINSALKSIDESSVEFCTPKSQIFKRNTVNLNCKRHWDLFSEKQILANSCFSCFKIQIDVETLFDLIRLTAFFFESEACKPLICKTMIETRVYSNNAYKGLVYCDNLFQTQELVDYLRNALQTVCVKTFLVNSRRGCSEFTLQFPKFGNVANDENLWIPPSDWSALETSFDECHQTVHRIEEYATSCHFSLDDTFILQKWIDYAKGLNDPAALYFSDREIKFHTTYRDAVNKRLG
jgi:tetratricopeptide (TPR) repeat protein